MGSEGRVKGKLQTKYTINYMNYLKGTYKPEEPKELQEELPKKEVEVKLENEKYKRFRLYIENTQHPILEASRLYVLNKRKQT